MAFFLFSFSADYVKPTVIYLGHKEKKNKWQGKIPDFGWMELGTAYKKKDFNLVANLVYSYNEFKPLLLGANNQILCRGVRISKRVAE